MGSKAAFNSLTHNAKDSLSESGPAEQSTCQHLGYSQSRSTENIQKKWSFKYAYRLGAIQKLRGQDEVGRWSVKCPWLSTKGR